MPNPFLNASPADLARMVREGKYSDRETDALAACVLGGEWVQVRECKAYLFEYWGEHYPFGMNWLCIWPEEDEAFRRYWYTGNWKDCGPLLVEYRLYIDWGYDGGCEISNLDDSICVRHLNPCRAITDAALLVKLGKWIAKGEGNDLTALSTLR